MTPHDLVNLYKLEALRSKSTGDTEPVRPILLTRTKPILIETPDSSCYCCKGTRWWMRQNEVICQQCHPNPILPGGTLFGI